MGEEKRRMEITAQDTLRLVRVCMENKKTIFITIIRGSLIRNIFHTGIIRSLLLRGIRVVVITPHAADTELFKEHAHPDLIFEPLFARGKRFHRILEEAYKGAVFNETVHFMYRYRFAGDKIPSVLSLTLFYALRMFFLVPLRFIPGAKRLIRCVDFILNPEHQHDYLFYKYKPDIVFNTASRGDYGVLKSAKRLGVPTVDMPKSWDNLSKVLFNVKADRMIVWSPFMKEQAVRLQGYKPGEVIVTGVPQFDFYARKDGLVSREAFCEKFGFDPKKKIILFSSSGGDLCDEAYYVELIKKFTDEGKLPAMNVLVRPHLGYKDDASRFARLAGLLGFVIDTTDKQQSDKFKDNWDTRIEHVHHLVNSLHHADVMVNIASTMTLDATACGTPVINVKFDTQKGISRHFSTTRLYRTDYASAVTGAGGTWVAESKEGYLSALLDILEKGEKKETERERMADYFLYKNDGKSAERIVSSLINIVNNSKTFMKKISDYSTKELQDICQGSVAHLSTKKEANKVALLSLKVSIYLVRLLLYTKITPNQITILSVTAFYIGISLIMFSDHVLSIAGALVIWFSILLDGCDGGVARFRGVAGRLGSVYVEPVSHDTQYGFAFLLISYGLVAHGFPSYFYILGGLACIMKISTRLLQSRFCDLLRPKFSDEHEKILEMNKSFKEKSIMIKIAYRLNKTFLSSTGVFLVIFAFSVINRIDLSLWFFAIGYSLVWISVFAKQIYQIHRYNLR